MTVSAQTTYNQYTANGVTTVFPYQFKILSAGDLQVYVAGVLKVLNVDYSVSGVGIDVGGSVTFLLGAPAASAAVSIIRAMAVKRTTDYQQLGDFLTPVVNPDFDNAILLIQDEQTQIGRCIRTPPDEVGTLPTLPSIASRSGKYISFDATGQPTVSSGTGNDSALRADLANTSVGTQGALLVGTRRSEAGSVARTTNDKLNESLSILDFGGNGNGVANNDAAFTAANLAAIASSLFAINLPAGDYLVTALPTLDARVRLIGEGRIVTTTTHRRTWEYGGMSVTTGARTIFVNPATGNDKLDGSSATVGAGYIGPIKTLQRAWNMLPPIIEHRITIQMADGNYEAQEFLTTDMERPAVLWCVGKFIRGRTDQASSGADTTGYVVFKGTTQAGTKIRTFGAFIYGIYVTEGLNVGLDEITLQSNTAGTISLLVAHRTGTYVQGSNIAIDGNAGQAGYAAYAEAGGVLELTGNGAISGSVNGVQCYDGSVIEIANTITVAGTSSALSISGGAINLDGKVAINSLVVVQSGKLYARGQDTANRVTFSAAIILINAVLDATFVNFTGTLDATNSEVTCNTCGYSNTWVGQNSDFYFQATPSFVSPAVISTVATPLSLLLNSRWRRDSATNSPINGSAGRTNAVRNVVSQAIASNGATVAVFLAAGDRAVHRIDGSGGNRINCLLAAVDTSYGGAPLEGTQLTLINTTANSVQIINSATTDIIGGGILLGSAGGSANYKGITLVWENAAWREASRSLIVP